LRQQLLDFARSGPLSLTLQYFIFQGEPLVDCGDSKTGLTEGSIRGCSCGA
jgi:hypothetical protein